jgi:hypothetical protein
MRVQAKYNALFNEMRAAQDELGVREVVDSHCEPLNLLRQSVKSSILNG